MNSVIHLRHDTPIPLAALASLMAMAAGRTPVMVATVSAMPASRLAALATGLAPRRMETVMVGDHVPAADRALIEDLLHDRAIPVILTTTDPPPTDLTSWLDRAPCYTPTPAAPRPRLLLGSPATPSDANPSGSAAGRSRAGRSRQGDLGPAPRRQEPVRHWYAHCPATNLWASS